jgi:hypothetical protein
MTAMALTVEGRLDECLLVLDLIICALGSEATNPVQQGQSAVQHENHRKW